MLQTPYNKYIMVPLIINKWISNLDVDLKEIQELGTYLNESVIF
jgi:hypothetical protein